MTIQDIAGLNAEAYRRGVPFIDYGYGPMRAIDPEIIYEQRIMNGILNCWLETIRYRDDAVARLYWRWLAVREEWNADPQWTEATLCVGEMR